MEEQEMSFMDAVISGLAKLEEIDNYIESWHTGTDERELYEYLGMTKEEYSKFFLKEESLADIVEARKKSNSYV